MSRQETHKGRIKRTGLNLTEWMSKNQDLVLFSYKGQDDLYEIFYNGLTCGYEKFLLLDGEVYEVIENKELDINDLFEITQNDDGTYSYFVSYWNGGCGFNEAISYAWESRE